MDADHPVVGAHRHQLPASRSTQADDLFGSTVQLAARLCAQAEPGQVLVSNVIADLCIGKGLKFHDAAQGSSQGLRHRDSDNGGRTGLLEPSATSPQRQAKVESRLSRRAGNQTLMFLTLRVARTRGH